VLTTASGQWITTGSDIYYNTGSVLIGTTSQSSPPVAGKVNIVGITSLGQYAGNSQSAIIYMPDTAGGTIFYQKNAGSLSWGSGANPYSGNTEFMRIDSTGNLLVGITSSTPANDGGVGFCAGSLAGYGSTYVKIPNTAGSGYGAFTIFRGSSAIGSISYNGTGVNYNNTSDQRLKENIVNSPLAIDVLEKIKIRSFDWKESEAHTVFGVIAQELFDIAPEAVTQGVDNEDGTPKTYWGVDYGKLVPHLVKAIQEQQTIINELKTRITALENK
jgi:hypothetical protein